MNYVQTKASRQLGVSSPGSTIVSLSITTNGYPVKVDVSGDCENTGAGGWTILALYRDGTKVGQNVHTEGSAASENNPYSLTVIDAPAAGTYTYALKIVDSAVAGGTFNWGESEGPILTAIELSGATGVQGIQGTSGTTSNAFTTIATPSGTSPVADNTADTLTFTAGTGITITGDSSADSIAIATNGATANGASTLILRDASGSFAANQATLVSQKFGLDAGAPSFDAYNAGVRVILYDNIGATSAGYAIGINSGEFWHTTSDTTGSYKWYGGTTLAGTLTGTGAFTAVANVSAPQLISTVASGTAPFTVSSNTVVPNLNADLLDGYNTATAATANTIVVRDANASITANVVTADGGLVAQSLKSSFASAAARDAAITSPVEGMICYLEDVNQVTSYLGSAWFPIAGQMPFFDVQKSADQTNVASSTITTVTWPTATTNRGGFTVASNQVTVPIAGIYMINAAVTFDAGNTAGNNRHILIYVNGGAVTRDYGFPGNTVDSALRSTITLLLDAGDVVDVRAYQTSGSNMTLELTRTRLTILYVGP
jgi:hypothetical protein